MYINVKVCVSMTISIPIYIYMQRIFLERLDSEMGDSREWTLGSDDREKHTFRCLLFCSL